MSETPKRTLLDIFNKYNPGPEARELLLSAGFKELYILTDSGFKPVKL